MAEDLDKLLLDPENFNRDGIDLERLPLEEVFEQLRTSARGVSSDDAEARLHIFGYNKLEEKTVLTAIGNFCICSIAVGMFLEIIVMFPIQQRSYRDGINNLLVLLIGGIPIAMPTVLSVTLAIGSHRLSQQGAITKTMTAIEEMAGMDVLCSDKTGTLTLNRLTVDKNLVELC